MKEFYNDIYEQLYDSYPEEFIAMRLGNFGKTNMGRRFMTELTGFMYEQEYYLNKIREHIMIYQMENKFFLRADAKMFLITNFNQMIIKPIILAKAEKHIEIDRKELTDIIKKDLFTILNYTYEKKKEEIVSGHEVMKAIDNLWGELGSTKFEVWG